MTGLEWRWSEPPVVAALRCVNQADPVDGSRVRCCGGCGEDVWISPATLDVMREQVAPKIRCVQCLDLAP